jgi:hypothetical protein
MGTTPTMGIPYPESTDAVANGATAMENLATTVDNKTGLVLVKTQTIGAGVSSIPVPDAFSALFDNYLIQLNEYSASAGQLNLSLNGIVNNYQHQLLYGSFNNTNSAIGAINQSSWQYVVGNTATGKNSASIELLAPFLASPTRIRSLYTDVGAAGQMTGINTNSTSVTGFTLVTVGGPITGGTIRVYGYRK